MNIRINCENRIVGRVLSTIVKLVKSDPLVVLYVLNWHNCMLTGDIAFAVAKDKYNRDHHTKDHGPYISHTIRHHFWRSLRGMLPKNHRRAISLRRRIRLVSPLDITSGLHGRINFKWQIPSSGIRIQKGYTVREWVQRTGGACN